MLGDPDASSRLVFPVLTAACLHFGIETAPAAQQFGCLGHSTNRVAPAQIGDAPAQIEYWHKVGLAVPPFLSQAFSVPPRKSVPVLVKPISQVRPVAGPVPPVAGPPFPLMAFPFFGAVPPFPLMAFPFSTDVAPSSWLERAVVEFPLCCSAASDLVPSLMLLIAMRSTQRVVERILNQANSDCCKA